MRYLGIDLGTTSCGIALTDKTNTISYAKEPIFFNKDDYSKLYLEILKIIKDNNIFYLETNTLPGMTATSLLPQEAKAIGISYTQLLDFLIENA